MLERTETAATGLSESGLGMTGRALVVVEGLA